MYEKVFEQAESIFKPMSDIFELNAQTMDTLRNKQSALVNEVLTDSIDFAKGMSNANFDVENFVEAQQSYWEGLREKLTASAQDSYDLVTDAQDKAGKLMQGAIDASTETVKAATEAPIKDVKPVAKKKTAAKKAAPTKKAAKKADEPAPAKEGEAEA